MLSHKEIQISANIRLPFSEGAHKENANDKLQIAIQLDNRQNKGRSPNRIIKRKLTKLCSASLASGKYTTNHTRHLTEWLPLKL